MNDDFSSFGKEMKGVKPLKTSTTRRTRKLASKQNIWEQRINATLSAPDAALLGQDSHADTPLEWFHPSVPNRIKRQLENGEIRPDLVADLHGLQVEDARPLMERLLSESLMEGFPVVQVIHGKGHSNNRISTLKGWLDIWLHEHGQVAGFCSCPQHHGGTGALYILIDDRLED